MQITEILGHILGLIGVCVIILSYQLKTKSSIFVLQTIGTAFKGTQFLLIGALSGFALNGVCLIRNVAFCFKSKMGRFEKTVPYIFAAVMVIVSIFVWDAWFTVFMMLGLTVNTVCLGVCKPQGLRVSLLFTCLLVMTYDIFTGSVAGVLNEGLSMVSAAVGLVRYRKTDKKTNKFSEAKND